MLRFDGVITGLGFGRRAMLEGGGNIRAVKTDMETDIIIAVGNGDHEPIVLFYIRTTGEQPGCDTFKIGETGIAKIAGNETDEQGA